VLHIKRVEKSNSRQYNESKQTKDDVCDYKAVRKAIFATMHILWTCRGEMNYYRERRKLEMRANVCKSRPAGPLLAVYNEGWGA
jgi:hypothetical protein